MEEQKTRPSSPHVKVILVSFKFRIPDWPDSLILEDFKSTLFLVLEEYQTPEFKIPNFKFFWNADYPTWEKPKVSTESLSTLE